MFFTILYPIEHKAEYFQPHCTCQSNLLPSTKKALIMKNTKQKKTPNPKDSKIDPQGQSYNQG